MEGFCRGLRHPPASGDFSSLTFLVLRKQPQWTPTSRDVVVARLQCLESEIGEVAAAANALVSRRLGWGRAQSWLADHDTALALKAMPGRVSNLAKTVAS